METVRIISVKPLDDFVVDLEFSDGTRREVDLSPYLHGEIFEPIRNNPDVFKSVRIVQGCRTISWANGADIDPYTLYFGLTPEWTKEDDDLADLLAIWQARRENESETAVPLTDAEHELRIR